MIRHKHITLSGWFAILLIFCYAIGVGAGEVKEVPRISVHQVKQILGHPDVVIIDVRTAKTWWRSPTKIVNAVREELDSVEQWAAKYAKDKTLIFYCS